MTKGFIANSTAKANNQYAASDNCGTDTHRQIRSLAEQSGRDDDAGESRLKHCHLCRWQKGEESWVEL